MSLRAHVSACRFTGFEFRCAGAWVRCGLGDHSSAPGLLGSCATRIPRAHRTLEDFFFRRLRRSIAVRSNLLLTLEQKQLVRTRAYPLHTNQKRWLSPPIYHVEHIRELAVSHSAVRHVWHCLKPAQSGQTELALRGHLVPPLSLPSIAK